MSIGPVSNKHKEKQTGPSKKKTEKHSAINKRVNYEHSGTAENHSVDFAERIS